MSVEAPELHPHHLDLSCRSALDHRETWRRWFWTHDSGGGDPCVGGGGRWGPVGGWFFLRGKTPTKNRGQIMNTWKQRWFLPFFFEFWLVMVKLSAPTSGMRCGTSTWSQSLEIPDFGFCLPLKSMGNSTHSAGIWHFCPKIWGITLGHTEGSGKTTSISHRRRTSDEAWSFISCKKYLSCFDHLFTVRDLRGESKQDWRSLSIYQLITDRFADGDPRNNELFAEGFDVRDMTYRCMT